MIQQTLQMSLPCKAFVPMLLFFVSLSTAAQMRFSFSELEGVTTNQLADGTTLVQLPLSASLSHLSDYGVRVTVDGIRANLADISPNPAKTQVSDLQPVVFSYKRQSYKFMFTVGEYFTAVMISDTHTGQTPSGSVANEYRYNKAICCMGKPGGISVSFDSLPGYVATPDIVLCLGDMDADSHKTDDGFKTAMSAFYAHGIPFVTLAGNHDLVPDYWTGDNPGRGLTFGARSGAACNDVTLATVKSYLDTARIVADPITDLVFFNDSSGHVQADPFSFKFHGVRFYCGQTYWFQKPYTKPGLLSPAVYYAPDGVIAVLDDFVTRNAGDASIWVQHYPFVAGDDCDRWWLDQNDRGQYVKTADNSDYATSDDVEIFTMPSAMTAAKKKKDRLADIICKSRNAVHFSGHTHEFEVNVFTTANGSKVSDVTVDAYGEKSGYAVAVLCKAGTGVVQVKRACFGKGTQ